MATGDKIVNLDGLKAAYDSAIALTNDLKSEISVIKYKPGTNLYDEAHNSQVQSNPQYTVGTVYLDGYTGDLVVSCKENKAGYIDKPHVYDANGQELTASFGTAVYSEGFLRQGKPITIPSGAARLEFRYRTAASGGTLVEEVMVTEGTTVPSVYKAYQNIPYLDGSDYLVQADIDKIAYVSTSGDDTNDGLTYETAVATFQRAAQISNVIVAERGTYNENLRIANRPNVKIIPYDNNASFDIDEPIRDKIIVYASTFTKCDGLHIEDVKFNGGVVIDQSMDVELFNCDAVSGVSHGFQVNNSNIILNRCYATGNTNDGFNFQGYGQSVMNDCVSDANGDDGCSHHYGCMGTINGGRFTNNPKGGVTPAYGSIVNIYGAYFYGNRYGIYYLSSSNIAQELRTCVIESCAMEGNTEQGLSVTTKYTIVAINCVYKDNVSDKAVTGTLKEYFANDPNKIAAPSSPATGAVLTYNGSAWVAEVPQN